MEVKIAPNKVKEFLTKHFITLLLSVLIFCWTFIKEAVTDSADFKFKEAVRNIVINDKDIQNHLDSTIDSRFELNLKKSLNNPMLWFDALNSNFVSDYAEERALEIREEVSKQLIKIDSIQRSFIQSIGKANGIRDEDVIPYFEDMMRDYVRSKSNRTVTATF